MMMDEEEFQVRWRPAHREAGELLAAALELQEPAQEPPPEPGPPPPEAEEAEEVEAAVPQVSRREVVRKPLRSARPAAVAAGRRKRLAEVGDAKWTKKRKKASMSPNTPNCRPFRASFVGEAERTRPSPHRRASRSALAAELAAVRRATTRAGDRLRTGECSGNVHLDPRGAARNAVDLTPLGAALAAGSGLVVVPVCVHRGVTDHHLPAPGVLLLPRARAETKRPLPPLRIYDPVVAPYAQLPLLPGIDQPEHLLSLLDARVSEPYPPHHHGPLPPIPDACLRWAASLLPAPTTDDRRPTTT